MPRQILALALVSACASCGTMVGGGADAIEIRSVPSGATVFRDGQQVGTTPCLVRVDRGEASSYEFTLALDGHRSVRRTVESDGNPWVLGNFLFGPLGLIGFAIDVTGKGAKSFPGSIETFYMPPGSGAAYWADRSQLRRARQGKIPGARVESFTAQDGSRAAVIVRATTPQETETP